MNQPIHALASVITEKFIATDPKGAAVALASLATHEVILLIGGLKAQSIVAVLNPMEAPKAAAILRRLPFKQSSYVLTRLEVPQAAKLWKEFSAPYQERLTGVLEPAFVQLLKQAGGFAPNSVGKNMRTDFVAVRTETKIEELIGRLKNLPRKKLPGACFVTGKNSELKGIVFTMELAFFNAQSVCGSVMKPAQALRPQDSLTKALAVFAQAEAAALPVVNEHNVLVGLLDKEIALKIASAKKTFWEKLTK